MGRGKAGMAPGEFRRLRLLAGLTQEQSAPLLGVTVRTVSRWETDDARIGVLQAEAIRQRLGKRVGVAQTKRS